MTNDEEERRRRGWRLRGKGQRRGVARATPDPATEAIFRERQAIVPMDPFGRASHQYRRGDRLRVLSVNETALLRQVVARSLRQFDGIDEVVTVRTVEDAITQLQRGHFDLVISDWHLGTSSMSGVDLLRAFRSAGWAIPFGLIAAEVDDLRHAVATNVGAAFVLEKPFSPDTLAKAIGLREVDDWVRTTHARGLRFSSVEEELSASLSRLCDTAVTVMPSPVGADLHAHRVSAQYATGVGTVTARVVFEIRLAASLAGAMTRVAPPLAERNASSGLLGEVLSDALAELGDILTRFVNRSARNVRFERLETYAPGERFEPEDEHRRVQNFYVAVTRYDAGVVSLVTEMLDG